jgi:transposase InsO family protein
MDGDVGMAEPENASVHERWANLRFAVVGQLLAAPPEKGMLRRELMALAARTWRHPVTGAPVRFGLSTIERWYAAARRERRDPVGVLRRKVRKDLGVQSSVNAALQRAIREQYDLHPSWSVYLHYSNLKALAEKRAEVGPVPAYSTVRRFFEAQGLRKRRRLSSRRTEGAERAEQRLLDREVRSYEAEHVNAIWHWDGHEGSLKVLTPRATYETPILIGVLDDRSRLVCHLQWYLGEECGQIMAHALSQAFMKRGLPRAGYHDNGGAMTAAEMTEGLTRLGVLDARTLSYSAYMNGKIETLWTSVEGQLLAMLENVPDLTLETLNEATQAWAEYQYNRSIHSETGETPLARFLAGPDVQRPSPDSAALRLAFTATERRTQRLSDGTLVVQAHRLEVPNCYRHLKRLLVRYARWDLTEVHLVDERTGEVLCRLFPQDKALNARGVRRPLEPLARRVGTALLKPAPSIDWHTAAGIAPLLSKLLAQQAATGLPPPYLPLDQQTPRDEGMTEPPEGEQT